MTLATQQLLQNFTDLILRRTHSFSRLVPSSISCRYTLYPGQPNTFVQSFSLMQTSVPGVHKYQNPRKTKHLPDSRAEPDFVHSASNNSIAPFVVEKGGGRCRSVERAKRGIFHLVWKFRKSGELFTSPTAAERTTASTDLDVCVRKK